MDELPIVAEVRASLKRFNEALEQVNTVLLAQLARRRAFIKEMTDRLNKEIK